MMRAALVLLVFCAGVTAAAVDEPLCADIAAVVAGVENDARQGRLQEALATAEGGLSCPHATVDERITLHLKMSAIHDRIGLHNNSRPVAAALKSIEYASDLAPRASPESRAAIALATARYYYRAEAPDSDYPMARASVRDALARFEELGDPHGRADAVHLTGLMHLQRRELERARDYFERSLALEQRAESPRPVFLADYERHVGFVDQLSGDWAAAIERFERSFAIRRNNGLKDQAMFAAVSLASALLSGGHVADADAPLQFALATAAELDSAAGRARAGRVLVELYKQLGERQDTIEVTMATSLGDIRIELYPQRAPLTAGNFLRLIDGGYLDGASFYRVVSPANDNGNPVISVIQGGLGDAAGPFPPIPHETTADTGLLHVDGAVSMARAEPGTASTEFFICIGDQPALDFGATRNPDGQGFAVFGQVVDGMDVVRAIHEAPADAPTDIDYFSGQLLGNPVVIRSLRRVGR